MAAPSKRGKVHRNEGGPGRVEDLNIGELAEFDSEDGEVRFAGQRALIIDATAKGSLRKELVNHFGLSTARGHPHPVRLCAGLAQRGTGSLGATASFVEPARRRVSGRSETARVMAPRTRM